MKKIMIIRGYDWRDESVLYLDVSTSELMNKAYTAMFKILPFEKCMEEEIKIAEEELDILYMKDCKFCSKTGKLKVEGRDTWVMCPKCYGDILTKENKAIKRKWDKSVANYREAQKGDIKAIKKFIKDFAFDFDLADYEIRKVMKA